MYIIKRYLTIGFVCLQATVVVGQNGKIGINTTMPAAMLHVKDSSVLFTGLFPIPGSPGSPPVSGQGTRMMWYPNKAAFRTGGVSGNRWDKDSIGIYSMAVGYDAKARGIHSIALGYETSARGSYSVALGRNSIATGFGATAMGINTTASDDYATALGVSTNASGLVSVAMGNDATASGSTSTAMGFQTVASGDYTTAMGFGTDAIGDYAIAMGQNTYASGSASSAMGQSTSASGGSATAMGYGTSASGGYSTAMGNFSDAIGIGATSMGYQTKAIGNYSTSMGDATIARGDNAFAMGTNSLAKSYASCVVGRYNDTTATSQSSWMDADPLFIIANGASNNSRSNALTVLKNGRVGIGQTVPATKLHITGGSDASFAANSGYQVIGGITGGNIVLDENEILARNNGAASTLYLQKEGGDVQLGEAGGKVGIGGTPPATKLHITGGSDATYLSGSGFAQFGYTTASNVVFDDNEILARNNGGPSTLHIQITDGNLSLCEGGGMVGIGNPVPTHQLQLSQNDAAKPTSNVWTIASDARLKKDVHDYTDGLEDILRIHPVWFTYTGEANMPQETGVGVLAQELQSIAPYMVDTWDYKDENGNSTSYLSVDNGAMTYMLINAIREQQQQIDLLKKEIETLKAGNGVSFAAGGIPGQRQK